MQEQSRSTGQRPTVGGHPPFVSQGHVRAYTPLQAYFLQRLMRLVRLRQEAGDVLAQEPWLRRAVDKAIYSTFLDCAELGVGAEARLVLGQGNAPSPS
ncbi:MAG: hypothetical protein NZ951_04680 [Dehalococcoidia bacterium]|nr:hypothetical protein [Dehalococcoidia bacterium]MDW8120321.1 hypothetical protein [Chloroflexota bacterium]